MSAVFDVVVLGSGGAGLVAALAAADAVWQWAFGPGGRLRRMHYCPSLLQGFLARTFNLAPLQ